MALKLNFTQSLGNKSYACSFLIGSTAREIELGVREKLQISSEAPLPSITTGNGDSISFHLVFRKGELYLDSEKEKDKTMR